MVKKAIFISILGLALGFAGRAVVDNVFAQQDTTPDQQNQQNQDTQNQNQNQGQTDDTPAGAPQTGRGGLSR